MPSLCCISFAMPEQEALFIHFFFLDLIFFPIVLLSIVPGSCLASCFCICENCTSVCFIAACYKFELFICKLGEYCQGISFHTVIFQTKVLKYLYFLR